MAVLRNANKGISVMAVKYHCPRCGKRFIQWGAEKLGFKCPDCEGEELVRVGSSEDRPIRKPALRKTGRRLPASIEAVAAQEPMPGLSEAEEEEEPEVEETHPAVFVAAAVDGIEEFTPAPADLISETVADVEDEELDVSEGLVFGEVTPPLDEEVLEEGEDVAPEWSE